MLDLHNGFLITLTSYDRRILKMVTSMLNKAFESIPDGTDLILHSDQGWQYQHKQYQQMLKCTGIRQSMSRKGNGVVNVVIKNLCGLNKTELRYLKKYKSVTHFKKKLMH